MKIICIAQQKGGVGKTTTAINLAGTFTEMGAKLRVLDADPQQSALSWALPEHLPFPVHSAELHATHPVLWAKSVLSQKGDILIVDTSPGIGPLFNACVELSDLILLPCGPSSIELFALRQTVEALSVLKGQLASAFPRLLIVPSRVDPATPEGAQLNAELHSFGLEIGPTVPFDMAFVRAFTTGETVSSIASGSAADQSLKALADHIIGMLSWN